MKLDDRTVKILKNFSNIQPNLVVRPGNVITTIANSKKLLASAKVAVQFDRVIGIRDLSRFLGAISLFDEPEIEFGELGVKISGTGRKLEYVYAPEKVLFSTDIEALNLASEDIKFRISASNLKDLMNAVNVLGMPEVAVVGADGELTIQTCNNKNPTPDVFAIKMGETNKNFKIIFKAENFKFIPSDYDVAISFSKLSHFKAVGDDLNYYLAVEDVSEVN